jgi:hypothetical protein
LFKPQSGQIENADRAVFNLGIIGKIARRLGNIRMRLAAA